MPFRFAVCTCSRRDSPEWDGQVDPGIFPRLRWPYSLDAGVAHFDTAWRRIHGIHVFTVLRAPHAFSFDDQIVAMRNIFYNILENARMKDYRGDNNCAVYFNTSLLVLLIV